MHWTSSALHIAPYRKTKRAFPVAQQYMFTHWWTSYTISFPCSNGPDRPSDPLINQPTICPVPQPFCHHYCGGRRGRSAGLNGNRKRWCLKRMSGPLLIRALSEPCKPSVEGHQAPPCPLSQTGALTGTFLSGHRQTILPEKQRGIWGILLKSTEEKLPEIVCQHANGWEVARLCIIQVSHISFSCSVKMLQSSTESTDCKMFESWQIHTVAVTFVKLLSTSM